MRRSVVQPTLERANDPELQSHFSSYLSRASAAVSTASQIGGSALASGLNSGSEIIRRDLGYNVGDLGADYIERATGRGAGGGYGRVDANNEPGWGDAQVQHAGNGEEPDFFGQHLQDEMPRASGMSQANHGGGATHTTSSMDRGAPPQQADAAVVIPILLAPVTAGGDEGPSKPVVNLATRSAAARTPSAVLAQKEVKKADDWDNFDGDDWK